MIRQGTPFRPDYAAATRRDAEVAINNLARALALQSRFHMSAHEHTDDPVLKRMVQRGAVVPTSAATVTAFSQTNVGELAVFVPGSAFASVSARSPQYNLGGPGSALLVPTLNVDGSAIKFYAPGSAIAVTNAAFGDVTLSPKKAAGIVVMTNEQSENEAEIKRALTEHLPPAIDAIFFDAIETDGIRPSGLLFGVTPETSGGTGAMIADLTTLADAVMAKAGSLDNIVFVASNDLALQIMFTLPQLKIPVYASGGLAPGTIIALAVNALAVGATGSVQFSVSQESVLHMEDTTPAAISTVGTPNAVAAPARSLYQTNCKAIRIIFEVDWAWRTTNAVAFMSSVAW